MKAILVTGASSGIGYGIVKEFAKHDYHVFGSVRKQEDGDRLKTEIGSQFTPLFFDVTDSKAVQDAANKVSARVSDAGLAGLINNAGIATSGPLIHQSLDEIRWQFEVNVIAQIGVIQAFLPLLKARTSPKSHPGRIINISSVAGKISSPFIGAYVGSKHAFEGISHSLRRELQLYGIDVIIIRPGAVNTPIWDKESAQDMSRYAQTEYATSLRAFQKYMLGIGKQGYSSDVVGQFIRKVFEAQKPKTEYAIVPQPVRNWLIPRFLPARWLDKIISNRFNL
ncbi:MAG: SDR family oxidoreductase [Nostoc sp. TH1S01]|nr:SDR family oxidoreductase [Nostoc sp. TH1S01]